MAFDSDQVGRAGVEFVMSDKYLDIAKGDADVALRSGDTNDDVLVGRKLADSFWAVYASRAYVERQGRPTPIEDIKDHRIIGLDDALAKHRAATWLREVAPSAALVARVNSILGLVSAAKSGIGLAPLPTALGDVEADLVCVLGPVPVLTRSWRVLTHPDLRRTPRVAAFLDFIKDEQETLRPLLSARCGPAGPPYGIRPPPTDFHARSHARTHLPVRLIILGHETDREPAFRLGAHDPIPETSDALPHRGKTMSREDTEAFAASLVQVLEAAPDFANGWFNLGKMRQQLGQTDEAIAAFRKVVELDPSDRLGAFLQIARLGADTPESMPEKYVRGMFDQYAPGFEADLVETLGYRAPALLRKAVEAACKAQGRMTTFDSMLDLGCGTGLAGVAFRDCVKHLTGADLSPGMIAVGEQKKIYDRLEAEDIARFLSAEIAAGRTWSLVVAADVFMYLGDLTGVCSAVARLMANDALFVFTVETHPGDGVVLGQGLRYAHGAAHVRAALADLKVLELTEVSTRNDFGVPVPGLLIVAQRGKPKTGARIR